MTVSDALHIAAEAIRALPDRDLLELALRADGPPPPPLVPAVASAPPTAALRQEVAKSTKRPTMEGTSNEEFVARAHSALLSMAEPSGSRAVAKAAGLSETSAWRALNTLIAMGKATKRKQGRLSMYEVRR